MRDEADAVGQQEENRNRFRVADRLLTHYARESLRHYLQHVMIASEPEPRAFGLVAEPWQRDILRAKIPAVEYVAGINPSYYDTITNRGGPLSFMTILPRGHDKSSLEGRLTSWLITCARKFVPAYIVAADKDQGRLILDAMHQEAKLNPWLYSQLTFTKDRVDGPTGFVEVLPADAGSAYGLRGRFYIFDEWTHWKNEAMSTAVLSGSEKIPGSVVVILSNAGLIGSWQHEQKVVAESDPDWVVYEKRGQLATWMSPERVAKKARLLPPMEARRVYYNEWIDPAAASGYLLPHEVDACAALGRALRLMLRLRREPGISNYVAACDYGARKDRTVCVVLHMTKDGTVVIDRMDVFQGTPAAPVHPGTVYQWCLDVKKGFDPRVFVLDPHELEGTIMDMERQSMTVRRFTGRGGKDNMEMAIHLRALIVNQKLVWYDRCGYQKVVHPITNREEEQTFETELKGLVVVKKAYGWRFDHESNAHDDKAVAVGMGALAAVEFKP